MIKCLPNKTIKYNKHKYTTLSWITQGIFRSITFRDKLYLKMKQTSIDTARYQVLKTNLHAYNKIQKKIFVWPKNIYFESRFEKHKNNIKKTWSVIKDIINKTTMTEQFPYSFKIDGTTVTDKMDNANQFNLFFTVTANVIQII